MKAVIPLCNEILRVVSFFSKQLRFDKHEKKLGRKSALTINEAITLALFKQKNNIVAKKSPRKIFNLKKKCSHKTLTADLPRWATLAAAILFLIMKMNRKNAHPAKYIDSTDIPVCLFKNANSHRTMKHFSSFFRSAKGTYFGLKMRLISDFKRNMPSLKFTAANTDDRDMVITLSKGLKGMFIADAGYVPKESRKRFYQKNKRMLIVKPRKNMKAMLAENEEILCKTGMIIELNFRSLKLFYELVASLPKSVDGCISNHICSLPAYQIA